MEWWGRHRPSQGLIADSRRKYRSIRPLQAIAVGLVQQHANWRNGRWLLNLCAVTAARKTLRRIAVGYAGSWRRWAQVRWEPSSRRNAPASPISRSTFRRQYYLS